MTLNSGSSTKTNVRKDKNASTTKYLSDQIYFRCFWPLYDRLLHFYAHVFAFIAFPYNNIYAKLNCSPRELEQWPIAAYFVGGKNI